MKAFSIFLLIIYEVVLIFDNETYFIGCEKDEWLIKIIPIVICLILGLG